MSQQNDRARLGLLSRSAVVVRDQIDKEARRVTFSASSEIEVARWDWSIGEFCEVLDHSPKAIRTERLETGGAPLLKDHDRSLQVGVIEAYQIKGGRLYVTARFGNSPEALVEFADVVDGIRTNVSIGYVIHQMQLDEKRKDSPDVYRVTDWEPMEVSVVSIPADPSVGIGRSQAKDAYQSVETRVIGRDIRRESRNMDRVQVVRREDGAVLRILEKDFNPEVHERLGDDPAWIPSQVAKAAQAREGQGSGARVNEPAPVQPTATETADQAAQRERTRVSEILALGARFNCSDMAREAVATGVPWVIFRDRVWQQQPSDQPLDKPVTELGMSDKEIGRFSVMNAIRAIVDGKPRSGIEFEASRIIGERLGKAARGFYVPADVLYSRVQHGGMLLRDITKGTSGGNLVATDLQAGNFIELLRNASMVMSMGARSLPGLVGDVAIPRQATGASASWVGEAGTTSESDATFDQVTLSPKTLTVKTSITRRMLAQATPAIEGIVRSDLANAVGTGIDSAAINGSGSSNQPRGIRNVSGIGLVALGTNGAVPDWPSQVNLVKLVKIANAQKGALGFLSNGSAWGKLMTTVRQSGQPIYILNDPGDKLLGYRFETSENVPSNLVKGTSGAVCSAEIFGNWADLLIGEWGVLDLFPDPYTQADAGGLVLRAFQDVDVAVRHPVSFAVIVDMLTT